MKLKSSADNLNSYIKGGDSSACRGLGWEAEGFEPQWGQNMEGVLPLQPEHLQSTAEEPLSKAPNPEMPIYGPAMNLDHCVPSPRPRKA